MANTLFDDQGRFIIQDYAHTPPFASFLPGIAGPMGIPMWVFYVNRGQAIASFGVESKDTPIIEFEPANKAYRNVSYTGFRTFIKANGRYYEPFAPSSPAQVQCQMRIGINELVLQTASPENGLQVRVLYFTLMNEPFAGLVRQLTITNSNTAPVDLTVIDGLPAIIPFGVNNWILKDFSRTAEAWMEVFNLEQNIPFYRVRASIVDKVEVEGYEAGHFYLAFTDSGRLPGIVDPEAIFGQNTTLSQPDRFIACTLDELYQARQITVGKTPCGFFGIEETISPGDTLTLYSIIGHASCFDVIEREAARITRPAYIHAQRQTAHTFVRELTAPLAIHTAEPLLDAYARQTFLDNVLRGGWPVLLGDPEQPVVQHIYSRKHGDLERDYNAFYLAPEYYSQGNGNYRDVNQNRREDVWLNPHIGTYNIRSFMNLIQADGYNPLVIYGNRFIVPPENRADVLKLVEDSEHLKDFLSAPFTPGALLKRIDIAGIDLQGSPEEYLSHTLRHAEQYFEADFGEGYWIDHWTYNLDLIENYLAIYPEQKTDLLFGQPVYTFYDCPVVVQPRDQKYILVGDRVRQLDSIKEDAEKKALIAARQTKPNTVRVDHGRGDIFRTTLFGKLVCLALIKFASMDPMGMGIEMEAGRPGWYDALNGLPGLFGSSMPETYELARLLAFLRCAIAEQDAPPGIDLPVEIFELLHDVDSALQHHTESGDMAYWDFVATARETYRARIRLGFDGRLQSLSLADLDRLLAGFQLKVNTGIERALQMNDGIPPTYFTYQAEEYEILDRAHPIENRSFVRVKRFKPNVLPLFLEGPVRALKIMGDRAEARSLYQRVKASPLFDRKLKMYRVNTSLAGQPPDIGRARAFTPGWLENESVWLHMEYKYFLAMLKAGLVDEFYEDFRSAAIPFQNPAVYGRSPLENSSFIVSSAHPDPSLHGRGFVARLSGSTVELISILHRILVGQQPFFVQDDRLCLTFSPELPGGLFDEEGKLVFTFLGSTTVEYHNPTRRDTYGPAGVRPVQIILSTHDGTPMTIEGSIIPDPYAGYVRDGVFAHIRVTLS